MHARQHGLEDLSHKARIPVNDLSGVGAQRFSQLLLSELNLVFVICFLLLTSDSVSQPAKEWIAMMNCGKDSTS